MKLNYKKTIYVGFAFFLISAFWQAYDSIIPKILTDKFGMSQSFSGVIMALDNILALFLLPLFGALSDKCNSKRGRRTPYIIVGTIIAAVVFVALSFADNMQKTNIADVDIDNSSALENLYNAGLTIKTPEGREVIINENFSFEEFTSIEMFAADGTTTKEYTDYVVPARQKYAWKMTTESPFSLIFFIGLLLIVLLAMSVFRSPAVALMPDVTIKPLRSKANAIINLMGTAGGMLVLVTGIILKTGQTQNAVMSYIPFFSIVSAIMIVALLVFLRKVDEPKFVREMEEESRLYGVSDEDEEKELENSGHAGELMKEEKFSLILILLSVVLWYMGYNAVTSKYSVYASKVLNVDYNMTLLIAQGVAIVSFIPVGMISSKLGRRKTILIGISLLTFAFIVASFLRAGSPMWAMNLLFSIAGIGWATINVNSFPMVVELSKRGNVGKYTGYYYTASMLAQTITPVLSGIFLDMKFTSLFPYAAVFTFGSFVTMFFVKHGDSKPETKESLIQHFDVDD